MTEKDLTEAFAQLAKTAERYGADYLQVTDRMTAKLTGQKLIPRTMVNVEESGPPWAKWAMGLFSLATGNFSGAALAVAGFDFNAILLNIFAAAGIAIIAASVFGIILGPIALAIVGLGLGAFQADQARKEFSKITKRELVKHLPQISQQYLPDIINAVNECFNTYEQEVMGRLTQDIQTRKSELDHLLAQKADREIDRDAEMLRLNGLKTSVGIHCKEIEELYLSYISSVS